MIKKITDKDKEDWENFLNNKKKNLNKNSIKEKIINNLDKDKLDWENFLNNKEKIPNKGSAIFLHLTEDYKPTAGCVALKKKDFEILLKLINKGTKLKIG